MSRRPATKLPLLSMLDLLFGTFGAMIVVASLLTFLRSQEPRFSQAPMYFVAAELAWSGTNPPHTDKGLSRVFLEFELLEDKAGVRHSVKRWSPTLDASPPNDPPAYHVSTSERSSAASLMVPIGLIQGATTPGLRVKLQNLATLAVDGYADKKAAFRISVMILTAYNSCAIETPTPLGIDQLLAAETASNQGPSSLFDILERNGVIDKTLCTTKPSQGKPGATYEVKNGELLL